MEKLQKYDLLSGEIGMKLECLRDFLTSIQPGIVAVSGGLDSRFLASMICLWRLDYQAVFFSGPQLTRFEKEFAVSFLKELEIPHKIFAVNPLKISKVATNTKMRCYYCKYRIFTQVMTSSLKYRYNKTIDGTNASDSGEYRPGQRALLELGVLSPLQRCGLTKEEIRSCARKFGLNDPDQPSRPCLVTRFPYNFHITDSLIKKVSEAEESLYKLGLREFRVRVLNRQECCLQIAVDDRSGLSVSKAELQRILKQLGWKGAKISFSETLSGFFDRF